MSAGSVHTVRSPHVLDFVSHSVAQTMRVGQRLGELLRRGDVVALRGDLGTGKTHLIKGIVLGLGSTDTVNSPSFVLINQYRAGAQHGRMPIYHADLYRIERLAELHGVGLEEALNGDGVCLIEWADRAEALLPDERLDIHLSHLSETKRVVRFTPHGRRYEELIDTLKKTAFT
ncbi:MAG: tRNA (adenosine(37)-N6)-threonylcarbamoyltransferase complex ATPase subunit type 1 TsaE [Roseiflexaceae bacterium]|nr:tRNA (adenosine(37)-N6)-threonylcarbamoyltransferase complex ATPase subunit type 1 TsaE [Roseiflexus sp.]MDW8213527.1 tRNA (adenosine(37)-N6)-threonylcarbamoyltransferase complex ATPase subunit type 1 TsaE [Roseiflexaceae bacterium]